MACSKGRRDLEQRHPRLPSATGLRRAAAACSRYRKFPVPHDGAYPGIFGDSLTPISTLNRDSVHNDFVVLRGVGLARRLRPAFSSNFVMHTYTTAGSSETPTNPGAQPCDDPV